MPIIRLTGEINEGMYDRFAAELLDAGRKQVILELNSFGGEALMGLAIASKIRQHGNVKVVVFGCAMSAAIIVLAYGKFRQMSKEAWAMVHEDSLSKLSGDVSSLERELAHCRRMEEQWCDLLSDVTLVSAEEWSRMHKATTYMSARECLDAGLIDEII